jgi:hypothetical protein
VGTRCTLIDVNTSRTAQQRTAGAGASKRAYGVGADRFEWAGKNRGTAFVDVDTSHISITWLTRTCKRAYCVDAIPRRSTRRTSTTLVDVNALASHACETRGAIAGKRALGVDANLTVGRTRLGPYAVRLPAPPRDCGHLALRQGSVYNKNKFYAAAEIFEKSLSIDSAYLEWSRNRVPYRASNL